MVATFHTKYKGADYSFSVIGLFNEQADSIVFCCRYDWSREISLVNAGDRVSIDGTDYTVDHFDVDLNGVEAFTLTEEMG